MLHILVHLLFYQDKLLLLGAALNLNPQFMPSVTSARNFLSYLDISYNRLATQADSVEWQALVVHLQDNLVCM